MITAEEIEAIRASVAPDALRQAMHNFLGAAAARIRNAEAADSIADFDAELRAARELVHSARALRVSLEKKS